MKRISHAWLLTFVSNILSLVLGIGNSILLGRLLQPEGRGALASVLFWPHFIAGVGTLSINESIAYRISLPGSDSKYIRSAAIWLSLYLAIINCFIAYPLIPYLLGNTRLEFIPLTQFYAIIFIPFSLFTINLLALDQGRLDFVRFNLLRLMQPMLYILSVLWLWTSGYLTVTYLAYAALLTTFITAFSRAYFLRDKNIIGFSLPIRKEAKEILSMGLKFQITNLFMFANAEADKLIIILLSDNTTLGLYTVALAVASAGLGILTQTFTTVIFPYISKLDTASSQSLLIARSLRYSVILLICCNLIMAAISPYLLPFLFGKAYESAVFITIVLFIAFIFKGIRKIMIYNLRGMGKTKAGTLAEAIALCVFVTSAGYLFRQMELVGVGIAILLSDIAALIYLTWYFQKTMNLSFRNWWGLDSSTIIEIFGILRNLIANIYLRFRIYAEPEGGKV